MSKENAGKSDVAGAILKQLKDPFRPELVKFRPGGGKQLAYIDARDVMKRLDDVMGTENWQDNYIETKEGMICELSLFIDGRWIKKSDSSNFTKVESVKGASSGALKRAAVKFGVGRYLYYIPDWYNSSNTDSWDKIFLPSAPENWEDVAQLQADMNSGMDIEDEIKGEDILTAIKSTKTKEALDAVLSILTEEQKVTFRDTIKNQEDKIAQDAPDA